MFEDKHMMKFIYALLLFASIIIPGPIIPVISLIIVISLLVYKIKRARESAEGFEEIILDIVILIIVSVVNIGIFAMRISIENEYKKYNYSASSSQEITVSDFAEYAIKAYQMGNLSQFTDKGNHANAIKNGFKSFLQNDLEIEDVKVNGNKITCSIGTDTVVFSITKNDIKYSIK